ncbi:MAG: Spy/CpxP family protein refolding chaperone [Gemmatimonadetes bacterium]|nr:Spy/CpxP family protein refolding chaperone [Gemmatimonadota bacterium]
MKVIRFLAAAAIVLTASTAMAQGGPPGGGQGGAQRAMEAMMQGITLTDAQKAKVDSIFTASREESMKMRQEAQAAGGPPSEEMRAKFMAVTTKRNEAIKAVLTPEQQAVFTKNLENMPRPGQRPPR